MQQFSIFFLFLFLNPMQEKVQLKNLFDGYDVESTIQQLKKRDIPPYKYGILLMYEGEHRKSKLWYRAMGIKTGDLQYVYGLAWVKKSGGDNAGALQDAEYILSKNPTPKIRARTLYLLGSVYVDEGEYKKAETYLLQGSDAYGQINKRGGQYLCFSMLAMSAVHQKNFDVVDALLDKAQKYNDMSKKPYGPGWHHEIRGESLFMQGDYEGALSELDLCLDAYTDSGYQSLADVVNAKIGLILFITGHPKAAAQVAKEILGKFDSSPDRGRVLAYNAVTTMLLAKCSENDDLAEKHENTARAWATAAPGGKALIKLIDWAKESVPCPEWR